MSNGSYGHGSVSAELDRPGQDDLKGVLAVVSRWSNSGNWIELEFAPAGQRSAATVIIDQDSDDFAEFAVVVLEALGKQEMAEQLRNENGGIAAKQAIREAAEAKLREAQEEARQHLLMVTGNQRDEFDFALAKAEAEYREATGETLLCSRYMSWDARGPRLPAKPTPF